MYFSPGNASNNVYEAIAHRMTSHRQHSTDGFKNGSKTRAYHDSMWPETRRMLDDFYRPYNVKLAELLGDDRFNFKTSEEN